MTAVGPWHLLTNEYPPERGGVADYTRILAVELAGRGHDVHVWAPGREARPVDESPRVTVHRVCGRFDPMSLARLGHELNHFPGPRTILVQYVPYGFGWKGLNLFFTAWLLARRLRTNDDVRVLFHEVATPWSRRPRLAVQAVGTRLMALLAVRACRRAYISIPAWDSLLRQFAPPRLPITWLPVPATIPADPPAQSVAACRSAVTASRPGARVVGHFGTYGLLITPLLAPVLQGLLARRLDVLCLLLGVGGEKWRGEFLTGRPEWAGRVIAFGPQSSEDLAASLRTCDLAVQPYPDGASTRRTTLMAALANGVPVVTTAGPLTEPLWHEKAVALAPAGDPDLLLQHVLDLLDRPEERARLGSAGRTLYEGRFAIDRTVDTLLADGGPG